MKTTILVFVAAAVAAYAQGDCPGFPNCLYTQQQTFEFSTLRAQVSYADVAGARRTIEITIRTPNRAGALPVMIPAMARGWPEREKGGAREPSPTGAPLRRGRAIRRSPPGVSCARCGRSIGYLPAPWICRGSRV